MNPDETKASQEQFNGILKRWKNIDRECDMDYNTAQTSAITMREFCDLEYEKGYKRGRRDGERIGEAEGYKKAMKELSEASKPAKPTKEELKVSQTILDEIL